MSLDALPPFNRTALLLDLDGTLLDIAPTPDSVVVEVGLVDTLTTLRVRLDDALAIITGRPESNSTACSASEDDTSSPDSGCGTIVRSARRACWASAEPHLSSGKSRWYYPGAV